MMHLIFFCYPKEDQWNIPMKTYQVSKNEFLNKSRWLNQKYKDRIQSCNSLNLLVKM